MKSKTEKVFDDYEKARKELFDVLIQTFKIDKLADWINSRLTK